MAAVGDVLQLISTTQHPYNVNTDIWGLKKWKVSCLEHQWKHAQPWLKKKEREKPKPAQFLHPTSLSSPTSASLCRNRYTDLVLRD